MAVRGQATAPAGLRRRIAMHKRPGPDACSLVPDAWSICRVTYTIEHPNGRFAGYGNTDVPEHDAELTEVGPGTPCGEYMRRAWQPVAMTSEVGDLPRPIRVLGEDLVLFRDGAGRYGLLHRHCAHRGASLEFGIIQERGIRCCYHGWHYDIDGTILELPSEPADSPIARKVCQGAYPVIEFRGIVFAFLGPMDECPAFPVYDTMAEEGIDAVPFSLATPCNWLQVFENTQDPIHVIHLHARSSGVQFGEASGADQVIEYRETPLGMINIQTRHWGNHLWTRTTDTLLPNANQTGAIWEEAETSKYFQRVSMTRWMVPVDDTNTVTIGWRYYAPHLDPLGLGDPGAVGKEAIDYMGQIPDRSVDARQRQPGDYEAQVSQRPIAVHALEHRATSDRGVAMLRRLVRDGIRSVARGERLRDQGPSPVATYCQDTVHPAPEAVDEALLGSFGTRVAEAVMATDSATPTARVEALRAACDEALDQADAGD